jgi:pantetheine-phosphate adenylyltransferase
MLVSFPLCFGDDVDPARAAFYRYARQCLVDACQRSKHVFVCLRSATPAVSFELLQQMLMHVYGTLAQSVDPDCSVVVVDPSVGERRVLSEEPWVGRVTALSPCIGQGRDASWTAAVPPAGYAEAFPHFREGIRVEPRVEHGVIGGTFDRLHNGHRVLLGASAAVSSQSLTVGITSDTMIAQSSKSMKELVQSFTERRNGVAEFLHLCNPQLQQILQPLDDAFGPSIVDPRLQLIVVSEETASGGAAVNAKRADAHLPVLQVVQIDCWDRHGEAKGSIASKISSTDARKKMKVRL